MRNWIFFFLFPLSLFAEVRLGVDLLFTPPYRSLIEGKRIGIVTNIAAIDSQGVLTVERLKKYQLTAIFAPEHGFYGYSYAYEDVVHEKYGDIPIYSLHGASRRPTAEQLRNIDVLLFDLQDVGSRSYTYNGTLFYCMEEAAKCHIPVVVLDRPNPMGGKIVDGPLVEEVCRSFISYVNVPYCHGMTVGELASLFNEEYKVGCSLTVVPMQGWHRGMTFAETNLNWVATSPQIPEADTSFFYPTTGLIGHYSLVNIGIGYTLPFKVVAAPWIDADKFTAKLNEQKLPGVRFHPIFFRPFFGKFKKELCKGALIIVTDHDAFLPLTTQYTIMGMIKSLYPHQFDEAIKKVQSSRAKKETAHRLNGREEIHQILMQEKYVIWKLRDICRKDRETFLPIRQKYLLPAYSN